MHKEGTGGDRAEANVTPRSPDTPRSTDLLTENEAEALVLETRIGREQRMLSEADEL